MIVESRSIVGAEALLSKSRDDFRATLSLIKGFRSNTLYSPAVVVMKHAVCSQMAKCHQILRRRSPDCMS
jgi:hypothetical protein